MTTKSSKLPHRNAVGFATLAKPTARSQKISVFIRTVLVPLVFALIYASVLASLPLEVFKDRPNYLNYADNSDLILAGRASNGWLSLLANEPVWLLINVGLDRFLTPDLSVRVVIFTSAFLVSLMLLRRNWKHSFWMIIFLLGPLVLKNFTIHLRQGLAIAIFMTGYYAGPKWLRIILMVTAGLVHTSFLVIAAIGALVWSTTKTRFSQSLRVLLFLSSFALLGLTLELVASGIGARQGSRYLDSSLDISGLGFLFWLSILILFVSRGSTFLKTHSFSIGLLCFYVVAYFLTPVSGRVFESGILIVLTTGISLGGWRRQLFLFAVLLNTFLLYALRIGQPWLGWGLT